MDALLWGALVRMSQCMLSAAPTLVVGWLVAAIFERMLGRDGTFRLFGGHTWRQIPQAWLLGMLLPVCSLGVIPVMVQMRKSGISGGTILAFGLTAPLFNPISVMYGLTLADPTAIFVFCLGSLTVVTVLGIAWDWWFPNSWIAPEPLEPTPYGVRRIGAILLSMCQQAWSKSTVYILIAIMGVGLLSTLLPPTVLQRAASHDDPWAPVTMASVSFLAYVPPMAAIVQVASMFEHGNSIGASFSLLVLGTGINLGTVAWMLAQYRWRPTLIWCIALMGIVLGFSYAVDGPLYPKGVEAADHTHAFDSYCNPFYSNMADLPSQSWRLVQESTEIEEAIASIAVIIYLVGGITLRWFDPQNRLLKMLLHPSPSERKSKKGWDIVLPNSVIATSSLLGLVLASILGCYMYYPPPSVIKSQMSDQNAAIHSAVMKGEWDSVAYWIPLQEDAAHKLSVSMYIRGKTVTPYQQAKLKIFLSKLEMLEHEAEDQEVEEARNWCRQMAISYLRLSKSF